MNQHLTLSSTEAHDDATLPHPIDPVLRATMEIAIGELGYADCCLGFARDAMNCGNIPSMRRELARALEMTKVSLSLLETLTIFSRREYFGEPM